MAQLTKYSLFLLCVLHGGALVYAAESDAPSQISVSSTESQSGKILGVVTKKGVIGEQRKQALNSNDSVAMSKLDKHHAKQQAAPLSTPFSRDQRMSPADPDFWIYDASVSLNIDNDFDGYFSTLTIEFDADTIYVEAEVYARLYLARGDVFEEFHTTSLFYINSDSSDDSFSVESDLLTGFPTDDYELLIELYDGLDNQLVAVIDGYDDADLAFLPLESKSYEEAQTVVIVTEHGGSFGFLILLLVPLFLSRVLHKQDA